MPTFVVPCTTGHLPAFLSVSAFMFHSNRVPVIFELFVWSHLDQSASSAFLKRPACDFPAFASVSNQSAISSKPSWRAARTMPGYKSVYSWVSPATAAFRLSPRGTDRLPGRGTAHFLEMFKIAMRAPALALGSRAKHGRHVVEALGVGFLREIEIAAVRLALPSERVPKILFGHRSL